MGNMDCHQDMIQFWATFTRRICGGDNVLSSLNAARESLNAGWAKDIIGRLAEDVRGGLNLSEAMKRRPEAFSKAAVCFVEGGEYAGILDRVLVLVLESMWRCPTCGCWQMPKEA